MWPFSSSYPSFRASELSKRYTSFDYIVVGGGTAGCCLASRLSEDPTVTVLLIERGAVGDTWSSRVPLLSANFVANDAPAAIFPLVKPNFPGNAGSLAVIGEGLGGGSRINSCVYTRGVGDYNLWRDQGHPNWSYERLLPYFIKSEQTLSHPASKRRGTSGPWINQSFPSTPFQCMKHILRAADSVGIPQAADINSPTAPATCYACLDTIIDSSSHRVSTRDAFLPKETVQGRPNLVICAETIVTRLKVDTIDGNLHAVGVYYEDRGPSPRTFYIEADKEIILCAGAVATPQLLMLSGIGPAAHLTEFGIQVVKDMPGVGSYLKDHANVIVTYEVPIEDSLHRIRNQPLHAIKEFIRYLISGSGSFGRAFLNWTIFVQTSNLDEDSGPIKKAPSELDVTKPQNLPNLPDIEIMPVPNRCTEDFTSPLDKIGCFTLMVCLVKPKSHGSVRLSSADPRERATVDVAYLSDPDDYGPLRKGTRLALKLVERMEHQGYSLKPIYVPASTSDSDIDAFIHKCIRTSYHYASTCRMAPEHDSQPGVVDDGLKVHGVQGLRICDTSVFPEIVTTHTMAPAVVIAEKCADLIKLNGA